MKCAAEQNKDMKNYMKPRRFSAQAAKYRSDYIAHAARQQQVESMNVYPVKNRNNAEQHNRSRNDIKRHCQGFQFFKKERIKKIHGSKKEICWSYLFLL